MIHGPSGDLFLSRFFLDPEHVKSPILFKTTANQLDNSAAVFWLPPAPSLGITDQDLRDSMLSYSKAPAFARYSKAADIMSAFKTQFEAYTRQYPPFSRRSNTWSKAMHYWKSLEEHAEASIIAFVAIKIFSILGNSMPEERTVSRFTRTDTRDRANQDARMIVAQAKIYQHLQREYRAADKAAGKAAKPLKAPSLSWCSVKHLMHDTMAPTSIIDLTTDDTPGGNAPPQTAITIECKAGLEALNAVEDGQDEDQSPHPPAQKELEVHRDGVDIRLPFFKDLLADTPVQGATAIRSLADWSSDGIAQDKSGGTSAGKAWDVEAEKIVF
ncbi:hypothetical protein B0H10DRAFT_2442123 [Mycena sp. CBHHK59/15]|nr:hypothetical protein B0H10DRAFT_2442123 [Mycena sp. CBHHK59/15]